ncbi:CPBP family intramembrane metalloprotease [Klebsiella quasipneumoniae]|uniref:CPBP family intramembrane glutamic endopeptidase n=1 Tax=Klebsiella quasipneumoniae TaxID=1463165 RepID=UPI0010347584|nr:CPBP family intramembrane glutamic endopeptidase [Klebsiella quasipneumoniae]HCS9010188.1 CPBP family intramembrane metalloprotease [Klebsiella pneumoniae]MDH8258938.1 CPBP family intramembrane metalloprotease [Klebsiella quasipneumoniae]MDL4569751.1 CPBP family intramembrane metalloprotease [Klebsiella quasipneumoniae]MDL4590360.1 CPBP family intramembrane metalloprotease [Klebsiella quasipneumoniae]MDL4595399.1 CPBP family intramembrane metalloprotease [Klebsiella quasipneumoniae]
MSVTNEQHQDHSKQYNSAADFSFPVNIVVLFISLIIICFVGTNIIAFYLGDYNDGMLTFVLSSFTFFIVSVFIFIFYFKNHSPFKSGSLLLPLTALLLVIQALNIPATEPGTSLDTLLTYQNIIYFLVMIFIGPFYEEVFFRGCLFGSLCTLTNKIGGGLIIPALVGALIFSIFHSQYTSISAYGVEFIFAIILTIIRIRTRGLIGPIFAHAVLNLFAVISVIYSVL